MRGVAGPFPLQVTQKVLEASRVSVLVITIEQQQKKTVSEIDLQQAKEMRTHKKHLDCLKIGFQSKQPSRKMRTSTIQLNTQFITLRIHVRKVL